MRRLFIDKRYGGLNGLGFTVAFVGGAIAVMAAIGAFVITVDSRNCAYASRQFHRQTHYDWLAGCYVQVGDGQRVPLDQYRAVKEAR